MVEHMCRAHLLQQRAGCMHWWAAEAFPFCAGVGGDGIYSLSCRGLPPVCRLGFGPQLSPRCRHAVPLSFHLHVPGGQGLPLVIRSRPLAGLPRRHIVPQREGLVAVASAVRRRASHPCTGATPHQCWCTSRKEAGAGRETCSGFWRSMSLLNMSAARKAAFASSAIRHLQARLLPVSSGGF